MVKRLIFSNTRYLHAFHGIYDSLCSIHQCKINGEICFDLEIPDAAIPNSIVANIASNFIQEQALSPFKINTG